MKKKVLVIEAHSDDSAISIGGFLEKFRDIYDYHFALVCSSDIVFHHAGLVTRDQRISEYEKFVQHFEGTFHRTKSLPFDKESKLDMVSRHAIVTALEEVIEKVRPEILIFQGPSFHHDHTVVYEATIAATRPTARHYPETLLVMENPTYVHSLGPSTDFKANYYVTLTESQLERKLHNFKKYFPSQIRDDENYLSAEGLRSWARYRGVESRSKYAEGLHLYSEVI